MASNPVNEESTLHRFAATLAEQSRRRAAATGFLLTALVGIGDYMTGPELAPLLFYFVPVGLVAWAARRADAVLVAFLAGGAWLAAEATRGRTYSSGWILGWNAATRLGAFLVVAAIVAALRRRYLVERHLVREMDGTPRVQCPYCGSQDTLRLVRSLVCRSCQRSASLTDVRGGASCDPLRRPRGGGRHDYARSADASPHATA